jgi:hypothetical protein
MPAFGFVSAGKRIGALRAAPCPTGGLGEIDKVLVRALGTRSTRARAPASRWAACGVKSGTGYRHAVVPV